MKTLLSLLFVVPLLSAVVSAQQNYWLAGAAVGYITPTVNGTIDYVESISEFDETSPGTFVLEFDDGKINIGNGALDAHWVRDHVRAQVVAMEGSNNVTLVMLGSDTYMTFGPDYETLYYPKVEERIGSENFSKLRFLTAATHNHHGPDTSGLALINRKWFEKMMNTFVDITVEALNKMEPARMVVADSDWMFGLDDGRDPRIVDPSLNVMQLTSVATNDVIATVVQWSCHPEVTLGFDPTTPEEDCIALGESYPCSSNGKYVSADFPGHLQNYLGDLTNNGVVLYINGAIGAQIGPRGPVWEVSEEYPIEGDGSELPEGATPVQKSFRKTLLIGRELAYEVVRVLSSSNRAVPVPVGSIDYKAEERLTRLINPLYRAGLAPAYVRPDQPILLGYSLRKLYICDETNPHPRIEDCEDDNYETVEVAGFSLPLRIGNFVPAKFVHVKFGPVDLVTIPGEVCPEVMNGVPVDFDDEDSVSKYYERPDTHTVGKDYVMAGVLKDMLKCDYCWIFGLTMDAAGYMVPRSDFRITCVGKHCTGDGYISGDDCKNIFDNELEDGRWSCNFGQVSQYEAHYEEILSASWEVAEDIIHFYSDLLGVPASGRYTKEDWMED